MPLLWPLLHLIYIPSSIFNFMSAPVARIDVQSRENLKTAPMFQMDSFSATLSSTQIPTAACFLSEFSSPYQYKGLMHSWAGRDTFYRNRKFTLFFNLISTVTSCFLFPFHVIIQSLYLFSISGHFVKTAHLFFILQVICCMCNKLDSWFCVWSPVCQVVAIHKR